jgi:hypothetical protein
MTFDEIFQQYASQGFTKPIVPKGIETIQPIMPVIKPILPIGQQDSGNDNGPTMPTYDPNVGKNFYDYEADAYGVGPTLMGGIAQLVDLYKQLPTPINLAMKGANAFGNFVDQFSGNSQGINAVTRPGTYSYDDSGTGGSGTGGASESTFSSQGFGSEGNTVSTDFGSFDLSRD